MTTKTKNMKRTFLITVAALLFLSDFAFTQDIKFGGTHPPDTAVLNLLGRYEQAATNFKTVAERDARRKQLLSSGYFYHGMDGAPVDLDSLTRRQTKNKFTPGKDSLYSFNLFQYENTAILTYKSYTTGGMDKGKPFEGTGSSLIIMSKENGIWKVISDIIGQDPTK
jgi:hypothetical protein